MKHSMHHAPGIATAFFVLLLSACATQAMRERIPEQEAARQSGSETKALSQKPVSEPQEEQDAQLNPQETAQPAEREADEKPADTQEIFLPQGPPQPLGALNPSETEKSLGAVKSPEPVQPQAASRTDAAAQEPPAKKLLDTMSLEEKIGQIFMIGLKPELWGSVITEMTPKLKETIDTYKPGGVLLFAPNLKSIRQTVDFIESMQRESRVPLFAALDEEAGEYGRLGKLPAFHATVFPNNQGLGSIGTGEILFEVGRITGTELSSLGFNMNMAPVADVNTAGDNSYIGKRSFGSDPALVASLASSYVKGMQSAGVIAVMKHFPGHGSTLADTHKGTVSVDYGLDRMMDIELKPFLYGIEAGTVGIMTAHINVPAAYGEDVPATFSPALNRMLRETLGYKNLIITDALDMKAVTVSYSQAEAAVKAFLAGADILLMPRSIREAYEGIRHAVEEGIITMERLDESVLRILTVKHSAGLGPARETDPDATLGNPEHKAAAERLKQTLESQQNGKR